MSSSTTATPEKADFEVEIHNDFKAFHLELDALCKKHGVRMEPARGAALSYQPLPASVFPDALSGSVMFYPAAPSDAGADALKDHSGGFDYVCISELPAELQAEATALRETLQLGNKGPEDTLSGRIFTAFCHGRGLSAGRANS